MPNALDQTLAGMQQGGAPAAGNALDQTLAGLSAPPAYEGPSFWERQGNGLASAPINAYLGVKQFFGGLDPLEQNILGQNKQAEHNAPVAAFGGNVLMAAPTIMIPGANTVTGAGLIGAAQGLIQPAEGAQTLGNIVRQKAVNTGLGGALGAGGQWGANKLASSLTANAANATAEGAAAQSRNSVRDATLAEGRAAGLQVPNSEVAPTFMGNRLESLGGKAAIKQELTNRNQDATNAVVRKALGLPADTPISEVALEQIRARAGTAYQNIANLSPQAARDLEALKQARFDSKMQWNFFNRSGDPAGYKAAQAADGLVSNLENSMFAHAVNNGRPEYLQALRDARKTIAQTYDVGRALNDATGDVSAKVLGRLYSSGKPLSDGLDTAGKFAAAFPNFVGDRATNPAAGVGKTEMMAAALAAMAGHAAAGPAGLVAGAAPFATHGARSLALAKSLQKVPSYGPGFGTTAAAQVGTPDTLGLLARSLAAYGLPQVTSAGQ